MGDRGKGKESGRVQGGGMVGERVSYGVLRGIADCLGMAGWGIEVHDGRDKKCDCAPSFATVDA